MNRRLSIVTPCFNAARYIEETVQSVLDNTVLADGGTNLEYIVFDGGSSDGTQDIVARLFEAERRENVSLTLVSEPDQGMYDALAKGLRRVDGDVIGYLNAGDLYSPHAFEIVIEVMEDPAVLWLCGLQVAYNERSHLMTARLPYCFRQSLIECGAYGTSLPAIQQESTFWRANLMEGIDFDQLAQFRLAGDFYLWHAFNSMAQLFIVEAWLAGFKRHRNQLSENLLEYRAEIAQIARRPSLLDRCRIWHDAVYWHAPNRFKRRYSGGTHITFDPVTQRYGRAT